MTASAAESRAVTLSPGAARRIAALAAKEGNPALMLRLTVTGGGCAGFQYVFSFDAAAGDEDRVFERDEARLVVDEGSLELVAGAELDFVDDLMGSYFQVRNPNASSSCGCGSSFSVPE